MTRKKYKTSPIWIAMFVVLAIYSASLIFLVGWGVMLAFKSPAEYNFSGVHFTFNLSVESFDTALKYLYIPIRYGNQIRKVGFMEMFYNTMVYSLGCALSQTVCVMIMAYMTAKFNYKFSSFLIALAYVLMVLPIGGSMAAGIRVAKMAGTYGTMLGMFVMKFNFLGMYFLIYHARFKAIEKEYTEAAKMDGASNLRVFISIMIPMTRTTFFMIYMMHFMGYWGDYMTPLIYMDTRPTMALGLFKFKSSAENALSIPSVTIAGSIIMMAPMFILYVLFNKKIYGNLTFGGIKG